MGLFAGGKSKSSQTSYVFDNTAAGPVGGSYAPINIAGNSGATSIQAVDFGSVSGGLDLARFALEKGAGAFEDASQRVSSLAQSAIDKTLSLANKNQVNESTQVQGTLIKLAAIAGAVVAVVFLAKKARA